MERFLKALESWIVWNHMTIVRRVLADKSAGQLADGRTTPLRIAAAAAALSAGRVPFGVADGSPQSKKLGAPPSWADASFMVGVEALDPEALGLRLEIVVASSSARAPRTHIVGYLEDYYSDIRFKMTEHDTNHEVLLRRAMANLRAHVNGTMMLRAFRTPTTNNVDVTAIRRDLGDSVEQFAARLGVTRDLVITWECGESELETDLCRLLSLLVAFPEEVTRDLAQLRANAGV